MSVKQQFTEEDIYKDRDSQIAAIEKTFEDAQKPVRTMHNEFLREGLEILNGSIILCISIFFLYRSLSITASLVLHQWRSCRSSLTLRYNQINVPIVRNFLQGFFESENTLLGSQRRVS